MKYSFDTYGLYKLSALVKYTIRAKVTMKEDVDIVILRHAVNVATKRYPYFMVKLCINEEGAYVLEPNNAEIAVIETSEKNPDLCSEEINEHLLYVDTEGKDIYFNISHSIAGGKGVLPWIKTCIYQYVIEKFNVIPQVPDIRKPDSPFLPGEDEVPSEAIFTDIKPFSRKRCEGTKQLIFDYIKAMFNPRKRSEEYFMLTFEQDELLKLAKENDHSITSLFNVLMFKTMLKVLPPKNKIITGQSAHNPLKAAGVPNTHSNLLTYVLIPYTRDMADWSLEKLGTITRGTIDLQTDAQYSLYELKQIYDYIEAIDQISGYKNKLKYAKKHNSTTGKNVVHGTYNVNYVGYTDWGELDDYVSAYVFIVDGHQMLEISALGQKIFCCYQQVLRTDKYINAFKEVLDEMHIAYQIEGPYPKKLPRHSIKGENNKS